VCGAGTPEGRPLMIENIILLLLSALLLVYLVYALLRPEKF
jgi:K+-transporting ATPase KdpF subunit